MSTAPDPNCVHEFAYRRVCTNCGCDAVSLLEARIDKLDYACRVATGFLVNGQREDAEKTLRAAVDGEPAEPTPAKKRATKTVQATLLPEEGSDDRVR